MTIYDGHGVLLIRMSDAEALRTITSLSEQISSKDYNSKRYEEKLDNDGRDFSIVVQQDIEVRQSK